MDPTIAFQWITFCDVKAAALSTVPIVGKDLWGRVVFAKTRIGNYAKFKVVPVGPALKLVQLALYDCDGTLLPTSSGFVVRGGYDCDLDAGCEVQPGQGDFAWAATGQASSAIISHGPSLVAALPGFGSLKYIDVAAGPWQNAPIEGAFLNHQVLFCKVRQQFVLLLVVNAEGGLLSIRHVTVFGTGGGVVLRANNLQMKTTTRLKVDSKGKLAVNPKGGYDLAWTCDPKGTWWLKPGRGVSVSFQSYFRMLKYRSVLQDPGVQQAVAFCRPGGSAFPSLGYAYWEDAIKSQLDEYLYLLETQRDLPISGPPPVRLNANTPCIDWKDGRKAYLAHVAHSLWIEANQIVPWRLSADPVQLEYIFDSRRFFTRAASEYYFGNGTMGRVTAWAPQAAFEFLRRENLIGADPFATIRSFTDWCRRNLLHITDYLTDPNGPGPAGQRFNSLWEQLQWYYGYSGFPPVERVLDPPPGKPHITCGCWGTSGLFAGVLRCVNIPVRHGRTEFENGQHSRPEFIGVGQNLAHGDDPYNRLVGCGHHTPPIDLIFYTDSELASEIDNPLPLPGKTVSATTTVNYSKKFCGIAVQYKTDYLLGCRCWDIQHGAAPTATNSRLWQCLHNAYSDNEIVQIAADCDAEISALGGCSQIPPI